MFTPEEGEYTLDLHSERFTEFIRSRVIPVSGSLSQPDQQT